MMRWYCERRAKRVRAGSAQRRRRRRKKEGAHLEQQSVHEDLHVDPAPASHEHVVSFVTE